MTINTLAVERFSAVSLKPFATVLKALKSGIGQPDMAAFEKANRSVRNFAELEEAVQKAISPIGLMLFMELDLGAVLRLESERNTPNIVRLIAGNPLIMKEMVKYVPDAGSYAPVTILVDERPDGVHVSYDRMASLLVPYGDTQALIVARDLDTKVENLIREAVA